MKAIVAMLISVVISGCATKIHSDGKTVLIDHGTRDADEAVAMAIQECAKFDKTMEFEDMRCPMRCISKFRCVSR